MPTRSFRVILIAYLTAAFILAQPESARAYQKIGTMGTTSVDPSYQIGPEIETQLQAAISDLFHPYTTYSPDIDPDAVGVGDFNNDGLQDVALTGNDRSTYVSSLYIFLQDSNGMLGSPVEYPAGGRPESLAVGDLNDDGRDDVVVATISDSKISVYLQKNDGTMANGVGYSTKTGPDAVVCGDFNNDGKDDVAVSHWNAPYLRVFIQGEGDVLSPVDYSSPQAGYDDIDAGDLNNDGRMDIVKINGQGYYNPNLSVYIQDQDGGLFPAASYDIGNTNANGGAVGDLNGDGRQDVVMTYGGNSPSAKINIWAQNETGVLISSINYSAYDIPESVETGDVNGDGLTDAVVIHGGWNSLGVFLQQRDGNLASYELYPLPYASHYQPQGMDLGDINGDGNLDVVIADYNHGLVVLYHKDAGFRMMISPESQKVRPGETVSYQVQLLPAIDFTDPVTLSLDGLPPGVTASWSSNPVIGPDYKTTLTLDVSVKTIYSNYLMSLTAEGGQFVRRAQISLSIGNFQAMYLPLVQLGPTILFSDDFSDPLSGWPSSITQNGIWAYVDGEYQLQPLSAYTVLWASPNHSVADFDLNVNARQVSSIYGAYGIIFGLNDAETQFYSFTIDPADQSWLLLRWEGASSYKVTSGTSLAINNGTNQNHIQVIRKGTTMTFKVNGVVLDTLTIATYSGFRRIGLMGYSWDQGGVDVRFDNYLVTEP